MEHQITQPLVAGRFSPPNWLRPWITGINHFLYSPAFPFVIAFLGAIANIWSLELEIYTVYTTIYILMCLFCRDFLPLVPMFICCYIIPSNENNPARHDVSIFFAGNGAAHIVVLAVIVVGFWLFRLCVDTQLNFRHIFDNKYHLLSGMAVLGLAYMCGGIGMNGYFELAGKNIFFGLVQLLALALPYFVIATMVKWHQVPQDSLAYVGTAVGFLILAELVNIYITQPIIVNGIIDREYIYTGWGIHNNIGGMLTMMLPFPFYFACKSRRNWAGILCGSFIMLGIIMTTSRSSMLVGAVIYMLCIILTLIISKKKAVAIGLLACIVAAFIFCLVYYKDMILSLFNYIVVNGFDSNGRDEIYIHGMKQFLKYPIFGATFYPTDYTPWQYSILESFSSFFPPRWHNTVVQLLACCGIVGLGAYLFHCVQVLRLVIRKATLLKTFIGISALALMATSMLDCHFFNIGPVLFYSMALAFAEKAEVGNNRGKYEKAPCD